MSLTRFAVKNWQLTLVAFFLAALLGVQAFLSIPRSVDPQVPFALAVTTAVLPGADAAEIEETVAKPIEDVLQGLDNVKEVASSSSDGVAVISVEFVHGTDAEQALDRTIREVTAIRGQLPQGLTRLDFRRPRPTEAAVLQLALVSEGASWRRMEKYAGDLRDTLNVAGGVRSTGIFGLPRPEVQILLDPGRLAEAQLSAAAVAAAIQTSGIEIITTNEARNPSGKSVISTNASAIEKSRASSPRRRSMSLVWSKPTCSEMSGGSTLRNSLILPSRASRSTGAETLSFCFTATNTARCPL